MDKAKDIRKGNGFGFKDEKGFIRMIKCFDCGRENYAPCVNSGFCAFCGHDANAKKGVKRAKVNEKTK